MFALCQFVNEYLYHVLNFVLVSQLLGTFFLFDSDPAFKNDKVMINGCTQLNDLVSLRQSHNFCVFHYVLDDLWVAHLSQLLKIFDV